MKIGEEAYVHGYIDEIRNGVIIIRNKGGYFGTEPEEVFPSAQPERKKGKWIPYSKVYECRYECSSCGYHLIGIHESEANFCPNCGADMRVGEEE